eukprot:170135-Rhodomonas_salina.4
MPGLSARVHHCSGLTQCMLLKALRAQDEAKTEAGGAGIMLSIALFGRGMVLIRAMALALAGGGRSPAVELQRGVRRLHQTHVPWLMLQMLQVSRSHTSVASRTRRCDKTVSRRREAIEL